MPKITNKYEQICGLKNLYSAAHNTLIRGRRFTREGAGFKSNLEVNISKIQKELISKTYKPGKYKKFILREPKEREVLVSPIKDRVVHHALCDVIEPLIDKRFIFDSYACRRDKGTHKAIRRAQCSMNACDYVIHLDVKKFFNNINHKILKRILRKHIADKEVLLIFDRIIDGANLLENNKAQNIQLDLFPEIPGENKGLPIGNLTSQLFANIYLNELDQYAKHVLKLKKYIRYMDDFLVFGNDKAELKEAEKLLTEFCCKKLALELHPSGGAIKHSNGLTFLGWRIFRSHKKLKSANVRRLVKRTKNQEEMLQNNEIPFEKYKESLLSWNRYAMYGDTYNLRYDIYSRSELIQKVFYLGS